MKVLTAEIHQIGRRTLNEDYPLQDNYLNLFIVCDGVGGSHKGEEASKLAATTMQKFISESTIIDDAIIYQGLKFIEQTFDNYINEYPLCEGMATTMALLLLQDKNTIIAHCGDSRVYQVRNGRIIHKTKDHSFVQELLDGGYITPEEASVHPRKNQITRAIQGTKTPTKLEVFVQNDVCNNDFFLICSDGILESISDDFIEQKFTISAEIDDLKNEILEICTQHSKDNYTALLLKVKTNV